MKRMSGYIFSVPPSLGRISLSAAFAVAALLAAFPDYLTATAHAVASSIYGSLHEAVENGDVLAVAQLLKTGADVSAAHAESGLLPLHTAAMNGAAEIVALLADAGADVLAPAPDGSTALHLALAAHQIYTAEALIYRGAWVDAQDAQGYTPLHIAVHTDSTAAVDMLLHHNANLLKSTSQQVVYTPYIMANELKHWHMTQHLRAAGAPWSIQFAAWHGDLQGIQEAVAEDPTAVNALDRAEIAPLHSAIANNQMEIVLWLLDNGADPMRVGVDEKTPLSYAIMSENTVMADLLLERGVNVNHKTEAGTQGSYLHFAVAEDKPGMVEYLLHKGADLEARNYLGNTPLQQAAVQSKPHLVTLLLDRGAKLEAANNRQRTALHLTAAAGLEEQVQLLLARGADINAKDAARQTPVHLAALENRPGMVALLAGHGADLNWKDKDGNTPLHSVAAAGLREVAEALLAKDADIDAFDRDRQTPLHVAFQLKKRELVELLVNAGANVNAADKNGETALHKALRAEMFDIYGRMVEEGGDIHVEDRRGRSLVYAAAESDSAEVLRSLSEQGLDLHVRDRQESTPLHAAAARGSDGCTAFLIEQGAEIEARTREGQTPLHLAAERGHIVVVKTLLQYDADLLATDNEGRLPLHLSTGAGHWGPAQIFILRGLSIDTPDKQGNTPLHYAARNGHVRAAMLLIAKGCDYTIKNAAGESVLEVAEAPPLRRAPVVGLTPMQITQRTAYERTINYLRGVIINDYHGAASRGEIETLGKLQATFPDYIDTMLFGRSPLHKAVEKGQVEAAAFLLEHASNPDILTTTAARDSAVHLAAAVGNATLVKLLVDKGARLELKNGDGMTPLDIAETRGASEIVDVLRAAGSQG